MVLNPNPETELLMKKSCCWCGRKITVLRVDWKNRDDFKCQTCKTLGREASIEQFRMAQSGGIGEHTKIIKQEAGGLSEDEK